MRAVFVLSAIAMVAVIAMLLPAHTTAAESHVVVLNSQNFRERVSDTSLSWFIMFYAPWCGHCKRLHPAWETLATNLVGQANIAKLDANDPSCKPIAQKYGVTGYPTIKLFLAGPDGSNDKYAGPRTIESFTHYLKQKDALGMPEITLHYFKTRGRAELIRLVLEEAGLRYKQELVAPEDWPGVKKEGIASGRLLFGQMPALTYGAQNLVQTEAIIRYLGEKRGLVPVDAEQQARMNMVLGGYGDLRAKIGAIVYNEDYLSRMHTHIRDVAPAWLGYFENILGNKAYFVGNSISIADLAVFDVLNLHLQMDPRVLDEFDGLQRFHMAIRNRAKLQEYFKSDRRPQYQNGLSAFYDNEKVPGKKVFGVDGLAPAHVHSEL